ncbi:MAG TPA: XdhC/CoxI family protein [Kofleriaceae bacterium]|nr:XdhC/CoxI family protein [Kofleriaceae bacterium]
MTEPTGRATEREIDRASQTATHDTDAVLAQALAWLAAGRRVALATVARTWGSSPRPAGSKLAVADAAEFVGSVSGGCIEGAVIQEALELMAIGGSRVLSFGVSDETAWEVGLACGGKIEILIEVVAPGAPGAGGGERPAAGGVARGVLEDLLAARRARRQVVLATPLAGGVHRLIPVPPGAPAQPADPLAASAAEVARRDQAEVIDAAGGAVLLEPHLAPLRLIVIGAVHVAQPLAEMAQLSGFAVTIVDPRRAFATEARFPGQALVIGWPDAAIADLAPDARTAVVALTHDPKLDDPGLITALASPAFYIGCLGSTRTHAARRARLGERGITAAAVDRLHGPIGLRIGARTPAEIAVSILAEIVAALRGAAGPAGAAGAAGAA